MDNLKKNIKNIINQNKSTENNTESDTEANTKSKVMGTYHMVLICTYNGNYNTIILIDFI